ncbi:hypothetical protein COLO4_26803 [Corchorus olitorius]|uniref:F-box/LRR-repeat protein 15/At3g58940/PEG3-like LRR domain-containing protein n=1 Tax=Corchorus olitorius TaxID=93759 RepID=A0A1R3HU42_9ROSI|nr:hypothetical protein COLO4_26803 [Corchorus olitorius]
MIADQVDKYMDLIEKSLKQIQDRKALIQRFQLDLLRTRELHRYFNYDQFMELANKNLIKILILRGLPPLIKSPHYHVSLPWATFASNSFSVVKIRGCDLGPEINSKFPCLRVLSLTFVKLDEEIIDSLLANCPLLETLTLQLEYYDDYCAHELCNLAKIKLRNLPKLKKATIGGVDKMEIESLDHIQVIVLHCKSGPYDIGDEKLINLVCCDSIKELRLYSMFRKQYIQDLVAKLPNLETLTYHILSRKGL